MSATEPCCTAVMPPCVLARTPRSPGRSRTPTLVPHIRSHSRETLATPCFSPFRRRHTRRGEGGERGGEGGKGGEEASRGGGRRRHAGAPPPGLHLNNDVNAAARPARPRPTCSNLQPRQALASEPTGERNRRPSISCCRREPRAVDEPSLARP
jgi:hypothetical protein